MAKLNAWTFVSGGVNQAGSARRTRAALTTLLWALGRILASLAIATCVLVGVEAATRILGIRFPAIAGSGEMDRGGWIYDRTKGWFHAPSSSGRSYLGGPDNGDIHINSLGLRGREIPIPKPPGVTRILVFGDSFVFGIGVDESHVFTARLEGLLNRNRTANSSRYEVINMGVSGYSTDQELILFEELAPRLAADLVILVACDNDFEGNTQDFIYQRYYKPFFVLDTRGGVSLENTPVPVLDRNQRGKLWLTQHSNVWNGIRSRQASNGSVKAFLDLFQVGIARTTTDDPVQLMFELTRAFRMRTDAIGAGFLTMNTGHRGEETPLFQSLRPRLRKDGIAFLGLEGVQAEARRTRPSGHWDFQHDTHWNVDAHDLAAQIVFTYLQRREGAPSSRPSRRPSETPVANKRVRLDGPRSSP
jgi:hypothetical protein